MRNFQSIMFIWIWMYGKIFKSALVYFNIYLKLMRKIKFIICIYLKQF